MKRQTKVIFQKQEPILPKDESLRHHDQATARTLIFLAVCLAAVVLLAYEARLPENLRFGFFEATYTSP